MSTGYLPFADKIKDKKNNNNYIEILKEMTLKDFSIEEALSKQKLD
jgi:hypothetical protein